MHCSVCTKSNVSAAANEHLAAEKPVTHSAPLSTHTPCRQF